MTYWMLNALFLAAVLVTVLAAWLSRRRTPASGLNWRAIALTGLVLVVMTAIFDNAMIAVGLVDYNPAVTHPARLGVAPLEDFSYTIAAVLLLPSVWVLTARYGSAGSKASVDELRTTAANAERSDDA